MEPRQPQPKKDSQDRKEREKKPPTYFKPSVERLEERITPSGGFLHYGGPNPYHFKSW